MSTAAISTVRPPRVAAPSANAATSVPPPARLTASQRRELESELRRELIAIERRLVAERQAASAETQADSVHHVEVALQRSTDTLARRDEVESALARLASGEYGACARCGEPIPFGRLLVMPEATHCLRCSRRA